MASKQWTAEDIEKIWNSTGNGAQTNTAPLPTLNNTSKKTNTSNTYKFKPYEDKEYTAKDIEKVWKNVERGRQIQSEMTAKANSAPAKNRKVPLSTEERQAQSRKQLAEGTDSASMSLKEKERKENVKRLNNIARQTGTTDVQQYAKRFNLDPSVSEKVREDYKKKEARAEELTSMPARTIAENNELENIRMDVDAHNKALDYAKKEAAKDKNVAAIKSDILDDNTLAQMDARAKQLQSMTNRTQKENDELQSIYDAKEKHDKAIEREKVLNGENHLVNNTKYKQLMSNGRFASDMDVLVDVLYNNAEQDATVSEAWAANEGAKNITGGLTRDQYLTQLSRRYELTEAELKDIALSRKVEHDNEELAKFREDVGRFGAQHPLLGSAGSFVGTVGSAFEAPYNIAANAITGDDRYTSRMFNTEKEGLREGVKSNINSELGDTLYDLGMGIGDMGVGAAVGSAPAILAGNTANRTMLDSLDRGVDPRHAALYSGATGITDYVANAVGLDYAKKVAMEGITASGIKGALARTAVAGVGEGAENITQDVAQAFLDRVINGDDAELNQMYDALIAQGYTPDEAFKEVAKQFGKQEAISFVQGVGMATAMNVGTRAVNSLNNLPELERPESNLNKLSQIEQIFTDDDVKNTRIDNGELEQYNKTKGGLDNGEGRITNDGTGSNGVLSGIREGESVGQKLRGDESQGRGQLQGNSVFSTEELKNNAKAFDDNDVETLKKSKIDSPNFVETNNDAKRFADAFEAARQSNKNGAAVDARDVNNIQEIIDNGGKVFLTDDGTMGFAVEGDGNLTAVFKHDANKTKGMAARATLGAIKNGAFKGDCYGRKLVNMYSMGGFEPVGRMNYEYGFNDAMDAQVRQQLADGVITKEPDVYVLKLRDGYDFNKAASEFNNAKQYSQAELDALPDYTNVENGYDKMLADRDAMIKQPKEVASSMPENGVSVDDYAAQRQALIDSQEGMSLPEMVNVQNQLRAMDAEMSESHPEWFRDGKFVGEEARYDFSNEMDENSTEEAPTEEIVNETPTEETASENRVEYNLQFFAEKKAKLEEQLKNPDLSDADRARIRKELADVNEMIAQMDEKFYRDNPEQGAQRVSDTVSNSDMRIDAERAAEELSKDIGKYFVQTEEMSYSKARDKVVNDYEGSLNRYMNNEGSMYDGSDYDAIRILEQDIKSKRKQAIADGDTELAERYKEQLDKLAITRQLRSTTSGEFNQAAAKWIRTAEGAIDVANDLANKALDMMEHGDETQQSEAKFIRETADEIADYADKILTSEDLWAELEDADRRLKFENELYRKIQSIGKEKGIEVKDELAQKLAKDIVNGQRDAEALARSIAAFREYNFLGFDEEFLDEIENIFDIAEQYDYNSRNRVIREEMAFELLAHKIYEKGGDAQDKFDAWRYFAMLANTKTHERNLFGNFVFADVIDSSANGIASIAEGATDSAVKSIQKLAGKEQTGIKRTKAFINPASESDQSLLSGSWKDAVKGAYRDLAGHKYQTDVGNAIEQHKPAFSTTNIAGRAANKALEVNDTALSAEDFFFKRQKYTGQLASYLKANGEDASIFEVEGKIKDLMTKKAKSGLSDVEKAELSQLEKRAKVLDKARKYAIDKAQYATFNKHNETAGILAKHSKEWRESKNPVARFIGREIESLAAFKNTPANILRAMWDYSPVSFARGAGKAVQAIASKDATRHTKIGSAEVNEALELLSKGLVGTGIMALGAKLYKDGILTSSKDEERGKFDETEGKQSYALNIDGASYAIDSLAPAATALFIGAEAYKIWEEHHGEGEDDKFFSKEGIFNGDAINDIVNGTLAVADPVIDQSMLQGAASTLENIRYAKTPGEALMAAVVTPQIGYFSQALPTLGGQIARTADNTRRSLRTNTEGVAGAIERAGRQALNKLPELNKLNNPYIDRFGRQQANYNGNILQRLGYQTLAPFYKQDINVEPYQAELERLYNLDPENYADVLGEEFPNKIDGQRLTNEEWAKGQTKAGDAWTSLMMDALQNSDYQSLSSDEQYELQKRLQKLATNIGTKEVRPDKKINDELLAEYNGKNTAHLVDMAIDESKGKVLNTKVREAGLPVNDVTKSLIENNDISGQNQYKDALGLAKLYGFDTISESEFLTYQKIGRSTLSMELENKKAAEQYGVSNTEAFREALKSGNAQKYADAYKAITNTSTGKDYLGRDTYLTYDDTTAKIYEERGQAGLDNYVKLKENLPSGSNKDTDYIDALSKTGMSDSDKAYYFVLHKGNNVAQSAPKTSNEDTYLWYLVKNRYDSDHDGTLSKGEKTSLYSGVQDYVLSLGYSKSKASQAHGWTYK